MTNQELTSYYIINGCLPNEDQKNKGGNNMITKIVKLYDYLSMDIDSLYNDIKCDYLIECTGRDKEDYYSYYDGIKEGAINIATDEIITDEKRLEELFY